MQTAKLERLSHLSPLKGKSQTSDMELQVSLVRPRRFQSCCSPVLPHYAPIPPFKMTMIILRHCVLEVCYLLLGFIGGYS